MNRGQQLSLIGAIGLLVGAMLPWATIQSALLGLSVSKAGYEGDGVFTGAIGLLLLIGAVVSKGKPGKRYSVATALLALVAFLILAFDLSNVSSAVTDAGEGLLASVGPGIYVSIVGAILALVGGLQVVPQLPQPAQPPASHQPPSSA